MKVCMIKQKVTCAWSAIQTQSTVPIYGRAIHERMDLFIKTFTRLQIIHSKWLDRLVA